MLNNVNTAKIQYIAIAISLFFFFFIIELIRRKKLRIQYSLLWLFFSVVFITFSCWRNGLHIIARFLGIAYPPAAFFLIFFVAIFLILIQFSVIISKQNNDIKTLTQKLSIIEHDILKYNRK